MNTTADIALSRQILRVPCAADLLDDGQFAHGCHAQIARRANVPQPVIIDRTPKSPAFFRRPVLDKRGVRVVTNVEAGCGGRFGGARRATLEADGEVVWS
jgi:hypothetical protein